MNIILEGPDNSGKSTLAQKIADLTGMMVQPSEGREKRPGEINERIGRYFELKGPLIYDRHPVISQDIYCLIKENTPVDPAHKKRLYDSEPLIIYCRPIPGRIMEGHIAKDYDDPGYLEEIEKKYAELLLYYDEWALTNAHLIYRIGDDVSRIIDMVVRLSTPSPMKDIREFHINFGLRYEGLPRLLGGEMGDFRLNFLEEELKEYKEAHMSMREMVGRGQGNVNGKEFKSMMEDALDALVDLVYVTLGTVYLHGFNFDKAWRRVHKANMGKKRVSSSIESKRNSIFDVIKPEGWKAPNHGDLVEDNAHRGFYEETVD